MKGFADVSRVADDEETATETSEAAMHGTRPEYESSYPIDAETYDECPAVS